MNCVCFFLIISFSLHEKMNFLIIFCTYGQFSKILQDILFMFKYIYVKICYFKFTVDVKIKTGNNLALDLLASVLFYIIFLVILTDFMIFSIFLKFRYICTRYSVTIKTFLDR